jgi:hypothetical protein
MCFLISVVYQANGQSVAPGGKLPFRDAPTQVGRESLTHALEDLSSARGHPTLTTSRFTSLVAQKDKGPGENACMTTKNCNHQDCWYQTGPTEDALQAKLVRAELRCTGHAVEQMWDLGQPLPHHMDWTKLSLPFEGFSHCKMEVTPTLQS